MALLEDPSNQDRPTPSAARAVSPRYPFSRIQVRRRGTAIAERLPQRDRMTVSPLALSVAALLIMLWILWSDSVRIGRSHPAIYWMRVVLYLAAAGALLLNMTRHLAQFTSISEIVTVVAALAGLGGAIHFLRKALQPLPGGRRRTDTASSESGSSDSP